MFTLASSPWPRFGGDQGNRSRVPVAGPHTPPEWYTFSLAHPAENTKHVQSGVIVMPDESLRVCSMGILSAIQLDGTLLWQRDLSPFVERDMLIHSFCTALSSGETLHFLIHALLLVDPQGHAHVLADVPTYDGFRSPNLTYSGFPLTVSSEGKLSVFKDAAWQTIRDDFGYDLPVPAVYQDDSLAVAGYGGTGFCRVSLDGQIRWTTSLEDADLLPTINQAQIAAVGSLNDHLSAFFTPDGEQLGTYPQAAIFAEYVDGGWIALSKERLARLTVDGKERWSLSVDNEQKRSLDYAQQPIIDSDGYIFIRHTTGFFCCDPSGKRVFEASFPKNSQLCALSIVAPGVLAYVWQNTLFLGYA